MSNRLDQKSIRVGSGAKVGQPDSSSSFESLWAPIDDSGRSFSSGRLMKPVNTQAAEADLDHVVAPAA